MPRARKPPVVAPGETYGERQELEQLAQVQAMPEGQLHQAAVESATAMAAPPEGGMLRQPSDRPREPITAGMAMGPGPGPEALAMTNRRQRRTVDILERAAEVTGNPKLAEMAERSRRPIGRRLPRGAP